MLARAWVGGGGGHPPGAAAHLPRYPRDREETRSLSLITVRAVRQAGRQADTIILSVCLRVVIQRYLGYLHMRMRMCSAHAAELLASREVGSHTSLLRALIGACPRDPFGRGPARMGATASRLPELEAAQAQVRRVTAHLERATASLAESSSKLSSVQAEAARLKLQVTQPQRHPRPS
jgi:hypothetical protein